MRGNRERAGRSRGPSGHESSAPGEGEREKASQSTVESKEGSPMSLGSPQAKYGQPGSSLSQGHQSVPCLPWMGLHS